MLLPIILSFVLLVVLSIVVEARDIQQYNHQPRVIRVILCMVQPGSFTVHRSNGNANYFKSDTLKGGLPVLARANIPDQNGIGTEFLGNNQRGKVVFLFTQILLACIETNI